MADPSVPARTGLAFLLLLVLGTNWGLAFSLSKFGQLGGIPPLGYVFWQCGGAGVVLLVLRQPGLRLLLRQLKHQAPLSGWSPVTFLL